MLSFWSDAGLTNLLGTLFRSHGKHRRNAAGIYFILRSINVHYLPPCVPSSPPVCPCSTKTSLTPPISTLGSFRSAFRPPNLSFHFPRYLLITLFLSQSCFIASSTPFSLRCALVRSDMQNTELPTVQSDRWMDIVCG